VYIYIHICICTYAYIHNNIHIRRGKKKPLCEVEKIKVPWTSADGNAKGKLEITDVSTADLDDLCVSFTFDKSVEAAQKPGERVCRYACI